MPQDFHPELEIPANRPRSSRHAIDPATRRLLALAGGLGAALALIIAVWSLAGHRHGPAPLISADPGPLKVKPVNPGGLQVAGADEAVLGLPGGQSGAQAAPGASASASGAGAGPAETLSPPPEAPAPGELRRLQPAQAAPTPPIAVPPAPAVASTAKSVVPPVPPSSAPPPAAPPPAATPSGHGIEVQLAALPTDATAREEWARLEKRFPAQFAHRKKLISRIVSHDGHVFWRLRAGGFGDTAQARAFCAALRGKGAACAVADF